MSFLISLILLMSLTPVEDSAKTEIPSTEPDTIQRISVSIETVEIPLGKDSVELDIMAYTRGRPIGGFELIVETSSRYLDILDIYQGEFQDSCRWEQFSARRLNLGEPTQRWHLVSLASMGRTDSTRCYLPDSGMSIARVAIRVNTPAYYTDTLHPVYFAWSSCADNSFSDQTGSKLIIGEVTDWSLPAPWGEQVTTREYIGPGLDCFKRGKRPPAKLIDFQNGGVIISTEVPEPPDTTISDSIPPSGVDDLN